jgi:hypothetical protein
MPPELLTASELSERIDAKHVDVLKWTRRDYIPAIKVGGSYYYNLASVVEAIRRHRRETTKCVGIS